MKKIGLILLLFISGLFGFCIGRNSKNCQIENWYPKQHWKIFMREEGHGEIVRVFIEDGLLYVGNEEILIPHILKIK